MDLVDAIQVQRQGQVLLPVEAAPVESCWCCLPDGVALQLRRAGEPSGSLPLILKIIPESGREGDAVYAAWNGAPASRQALQMHRALLTSLALTPGQRYRVQAEAGVPVAASVWVDPDSADDWDIVQLNAEEVRDAVSNQVGVVQQGQRFPVWLGATRIHLRVTRATPSGGVARLAAGTELIIAPHPRQPPAAAPLQEPRGNSAEAYGTDARLPLRLRVQAMPPELMLELPLGNSGAGTALLWPSLLACLHPATAAALRVAAGDVLLLSSCALRAQPPQSIPGTAGVAAGCCRVTVCESERALPGHVQLAPPTLHMHGMRPLAHVWASREEVAAGRLTVRAHPLPALLVDAATAAASAVAAGGPGSGRQSRPLPGSKRIEHLLAGVAASLPAGSGASGTCPPVVVQAWLAAQLRALRRGCAGASLQLDTISLLHLHLPEQPAALACLLVAQGAGAGAAVRVPEAVLREELAVSVESGCGAQLPAAKLGDPPPPWLTARAPLGAPAQGAWPPPTEESAGSAGASCDAEVLQDCLGVLEPQLDLSLSALWSGGGTAGPSVRPGGLLLAGGPGSGKSLLLRSLAEMLLRPAAPRAPAPAFVVRCRELLGREPAEVLAEVSGTVQSALEHAPAMLAFEDVDAMCGSATEEDGSVHVQDKQEGLALTEWIADLLDWLRGDAVTILGSNGTQRDAAELPVAVVATCCDATSLPAALRSAGRFDHIVTLSAPGPRQREAILEHFMRAHGAAWAGGGGDARSLLAAHMDGCAATDIEALLLRTLHAAARRSALRDGGRDAAEIRKVDVEEALCGFQPSGSWAAAAAAEVAGNVQGWEDVGGLAEVRAALQDALDLPLRLPRLLGAAPLRLRTGVLLYGPPGCGKTHAIRAAVAASGVRCITVKGPEVLNKYLGASEAAVRSLFQRAAAAAPSVLFFDEFDALAPSRGRDSTGVTDRIVNQLLTELDGVHGLRGVCVIAATSRPDILDAALLRPGRLDRLVFCGLPDAQERLQILLASARRMSLAADADMSEVARLTDSYTGADLAAVLYEAELLAVQDRLSCGAGAATGIGGAVAAANGPAAVVVGQSHISRALHLSRPSLPAHERERLMGVYARFQGVVDGAVSNPSLRQPQQMVTLA